MSVRFPFSAPVRPFYPFISCSSGSIGPFYPLASRFRVPLLRFARLLLAFGFCRAVLSAYFSLPDSVVPFYSFTSRFRIRWAVLPVCLWAFFLFSAARPNLSATLFCGNIFSLSLSKKRAGGNKALPPITLHNSRKRTVSGPSPPPKSGLICPHFSMKRMLYYSALLSAEFFSASAADCVSAFAAAFTDLAPFL